MSPSDPVQLRQWYDAHAASLTLYARQILPQGQAEDAVQEAFCRLCRQWRRPRDVRAWLFRCVRNLALNQARAGRRRRRHETLAAGRTQPWFEPRPEDALDAQLAQAALAELPPTDREIVVGRIWGDLTLQEVARLVGLPVSTVHRRYQHSLQVLRQRMETPCPRPTR